MVVANFFVYLHLFSGGMPISKGKKIVRDVTYGMVVCIYTWRMIDSSFGGKLIPKIVGFGGKWAESGIRVQWYCESRVKLMESRFSWPNEGNGS